MTTTLLYLAALICAFGVGFLVILSRRPPQPERTSPGDYFQSLPWADFLPVVPRLPSPRRLFAPKRRGRHVA